MGAAIVRDFAERGVPVIAQDILELERSPKIVAIVGDLGDEACLERLRAAVANSGASAVVVAHGTFAGSGPIDELEYASTRRLMEINFAVIPRLLEATLDSLSENGGVFVTIASQAALRGEPSNSIYSASKWALKAWSEATDSHLRSCGVRVRTICPGCTESPLLDDALDTLARANGRSREEYERRCLASIPARRFGTPEDIAAAVRFLVENEHAPSVLAVNGGEVPW
jgi:NAD(P)-dependent dehydrogenase (short-subunit alcohol dehydrogenase family)